MQSPLIIGGGPSAAAAAILLSQAGVSPVVLERSTGPHDKVCGDFLSGEAAAAISALGIDLETLGPAPIHSVRLVRGTHIAETTLPFPAFGLSRRVLDEALLRRAASCGARVLRGRSVRSLHKEQNGFLVTAGDENWRAKTVFLATGKHDLRGFPRPRKRRMVGLKTYLRLSPSQNVALGYAVEIVLIPGGYVGLQLVGAGAAVLCALMSDGMQSGNLAALIAAAPHLRHRLDQAEFLLKRPLAIAGMPYGYIAKPKGYAGLFRPGLFRLGDQAGVIPSFAGAGIAIALASGEAAARCYMSDGDATHFQQRLAHSLTRPIALAAGTHHVLLHPALQSIAFRLCSAWPQAMRLVAAATRVPLGFGRDPAPESPLR